MVATTDCGCIGATCRCDGSASDGDISAGRIIATADCRSPISTSCVYCSAFDRDSPAGSPAVTAAAYGRAILSACSVYGWRPLYHDIAAAKTEAAADAGAAAVATGVERTGAFYGESATRRDVDARIAVRKSIDRVLAFEDNGGVALTGQTRPLAIAIRAVDGHVAERNRSAIIDFNFLVAIERSLDSCVIANHYAVGNVSQIPDARRPCA